MIEEPKGASTDQTADTAGLDRPVREHLARQLRASYDELADKPAYLGDAALPPGLEERAVAVVQAKRAHDEGTAAVAQALFGGDAEGEDPGDRA